MRFAFALLCCVSLGAGCTQPGVEETKPQPKADFQRKGTKAERAAKDKLEGKAPPPWTVFDWTNTGDKELQPTDLKDKVVLLVFWGVWSKESLAAIPALKKLHAQRVKNGLVVVGIHTTRQGGHLAAHVKAESIAFPVAIDKYGETVKAFAVDAFPAYYLIDRKGVLRVADLDNSDLERAVGILLKE
jgi:peroxiredoxin